MVTSRGKLGEGAVITLRGASVEIAPHGERGDPGNGPEPRGPCRSGNLCDTCQNEVRLEALQWLHELNRTYGDDRGRLFSMMSSSVRVLHQCHPPEAYIGKDDQAMWRCPGCGMAWRLRLLAEGYSFGSSAGPFVWGEWLPEGEPPQKPTEE